MSRTSRTGPTCRTATCLTRELSDYGRSIWVYAKYRHTALRASDAERFCSKLFTRMAEGGVLDEKRHRLDAGGYAYVPPGKDMQIKSGGAGTRILVFQKEYEPLPGTPRPVGIVASEREVKGQPFLGNEDARLQVLLPDQPAFDMAVNIFTYQPGATLPFVETHIMEHGLMMLRGQGVYRLDSDWHPVRQGDVIWMAPYCPQWFVAMGKEPAAYIYYKDVKRDPI